MNTQKKVCFPYTPWPKFYTLVLSLLVITSWVGINTAPIMGQDTPAANTQSNELAEAQRLNQKVIELYQQGKYGEAVPLAKKALDIRIKVLGKEHTDVATSLNNLALLYSRQGRYTQAEPLYKQALAMRKRLLGQVHPHVATSLNDLALLYSRQGRYTQAEPLYKQALAMRKRLLGQVHPDVATSLNDLASLYSSQGRYSDAEPLYKQALAIYKRLLGEEHPWVATSLNNLASLYSSQGRYSDAEPLLKQALAMTKRLLGQVHPHVASSLNNLALLYSRQGRYSDAEPLYKQALAMTKRLLGQVHPHVAQSLNNLAGLYSSQGRYSDAEPLLKQALAMNKQLLGQVHPSVAGSLNNLALLYSSQGRYSDAEPLYKQALAMRKRLLGQVHPSVASSLNNLAGLYSSQGRYSDAEPLLKQALAMNKQLLGQVHPSVATSLNNLAFLYRNQGRYSDAEPLLKQALAMNKQLLGQVHPHVAQSLNNLAFLYWAQGNINRSVELFYQGLDVQEKNLNLNIFAGFERQKIDYMRTISGIPDAIISLHLNSAAKNPQAANLALTTVLQRKGRILDVITTSQQILRQRIDDPESQKLLNNLSLTSTQLANLYYNRPKKISDQEYNQKITDLNNQIKALESKVSSRSQEFRTQVKTVSLSEVKNLIPTDTALVEIIRYQSYNPKVKGNNRWGEYHYAAYVITDKNQVQGIDLGKAEDIDKAVDVFRTALGSDPNSRSQIPQIKYYGHNLYLKLIQPIQKFLGNHRKILISPDSHLNLIPFEALVDNNQDYLVKNYSFTYLTSGRDLLRLQNSQHIASKQTSVLIADPYFHRPGEVNITQLKKNNNLINSRNIRSIVDLSKQAFSSLPGTRKEAQAIAPLLGVKPLMGSQATETVVKNVNSPRILHVATHGFFETANRNTDNPLLFSGLVLAGFKKNQGGNQEDGVLTALETTNLNLVGTKLVVFSACNTGLGDVKSGEGIYGLRRALVIAGSQSQLISLWKVDDNPTKDLMVAYYNKLLGKQGRSQALRQTQLDMLSGKLRGKNKKYDHPYYWAAFIPSGDWRAMGE